MMASKSTWKQFPQQVELSREETIIKEGEKTIPFLRRLIDMLQENEEVISFIPGAHKKNGLTIAGRIVVHDRSRVESEILPRYFNHASFASLRRQLNYFCFSRVGKGKQRGATYCNEQVIELNDILRLKRRVAGSAAQTSEYSKDLKVEEESRLIQQPSLQREVTIQTRRQSKPSSTRGLNLCAIQNKYLNSRLKKKRKRILNSIVPVVHLAKHVMLEEPIFSSKEQIYDDQASATVSPPSSINGNISRPSRQTSIQASSSVSQRNLCDLPSQNGNLEMFKKKYNSMPGKLPTKVIPDLRNSMPGKLSTKVIPDLSQINISKTSTALSIPKSELHKKEIDIIDGCASALLSLSYQ